MQIKLNLIQTLEFFQLDKEELKLKNSQTFVKEVDLPMVPQKGMTVNGVEVANINITNKEIEIILVKETYLEEDDYKFAIDRKLSYSSNWKYYRTY